MFVTPETFERHLEWLGRGFDVVRLCEWAGAVADRRPVPSRAVAITFDDGWRDNHTYAFPILKAAGLPATLFAVSGYIGTQRRFWPNRVSNLVRQNPRLVLSARGLGWLRDAARTAGLESVSGPGESDAIARLVAACKAHSDVEIEASLDDIEARLPPGSKDLRREMLDWGELQEMLDSGTFDLGSHTCNHRRLLAEVPAAVLREEICYSRIELQRRTGHVVRAFCYPNGDYTPAVAGLVGTTYEVAVTTRRGVNDASTSPIELLRIGMHEDGSATRGAFFSRLACWP